MYNAVERNQRSKSQGAHSCEDPQVFRVVRTVVQDAKRKCGVNIVVRNVRDLGIQESTRATWTETEEVTLTPNKHLLSEGENKGAFCSFYFFIFFS